MIGVGLTRGITQRTVPGRQYALDTWESCVVLCCVHRSNTASWLRAQTLIASLPALETCGVTLDSYSATLCLSFLMFKMGESLYLPP